MILTIQIEVDEQKYKEAIMEGWADRYGDEITVDEIGSLEHFSDVQLALPNLNIDDDAVQISVIR